jgi:hypothetical protein
MPARGHLLRQEQIVAAGGIPRLLPWAALLAVAPLLFLLPITHDAIWQIWLGRQQLHGARLYSDILEVNPPLWFWTAIPLAAIGEILGAGDRVVVIGFFVAAVGAALYLSAARFRLPLLAVLVLVPLPDFGQREHFALIATTPYAFAIAARMRGQEPRHPIAIGLFAAFGLCLKPHFLLMPLALEALVWRQSRLRPETLALATFGGLYAISLPLFAPAYFTVMLPMIGRFYGSFGQQPAYFIPAVALILAAAGAWLGRRKGSPESRALVVAAFAFIPAVLLQGKGFAYHSIPVRGFLCLAILLELHSRRDPIGDALLVASAALCCVPFGIYHNGFRADAERHLANVRPGSSVVALVTNPSLVWPMVDEHHLDWQLHAMSVWQIGEAIRHPELLPQVRKIVASDLAKRPDLLIIDNRRVPGPAAHALLPAGYLQCYAPKLSTPLLQSFTRIC